MTEGVRIAGLRPAFKRIDLMIKRLALEHGVTEEEIRERMRDTLRAASQPASHSLFKPGGRA